MELAANVIAGLGLIVAALALIKSMKVAQEQSSLTLRVHEEQRSLASSIHKNEQTLSQRQLFLELWPIFSKLHDVDPQTPVETHVVDNANALELIAVCWESGTIDQAMIHRTLTDRYIELYDQIHAVGKLQTGRTGPQILQRLPAIWNCYEAMKTRKASQDKVSMLSATESNGA